MLARIATGLERTGVFPLNYCKFAPKNTANALERKIRIGAVNYLNTKPLLYGLNHAPLSSETEITLDYPAKIATRLMNDEIDIGLVPVAIIPRLREYYLVSDFCIGCDGPVSSVAIFGERPIEELSTILLDYQSRTSVALARILLKNYWKLNPVVVDTKGEEFRHQIMGSTGGLVIGDRALEQRTISPIHYDLGEAWKDHTGLSFVFAAWISNKPLSEKFITAFNEANRKGLENLDKVIGENKSVFNLSDYYRKFISYNLDAEKRRGLRLFLEMMNEQKPSAFNLKR